MREEELMSQPVDKNIVVTKERVEELVSKLSEAINGYTMWEIDLAYGLLRHTISADGDFVEVEGEGGMIN